MASASIRRKVINKEDINMDFSQKLQDAARWLGTFPPEIWNLILSFIRGNKEDQFNFALAGRSALLVCYAASLDDWLFDEESMLLFRQVLFNNGYTPFGSRKLMVSSVFRCYRA
jgi:hypothetical protein